MCSTVTSVQGSVYSCTVLGVQCLLTKCRVQYTMGSTCSQVCSVSYTGSNPMEMFNIKKTNPSAETDRWEVHCTALNFPALHCTALHWITCSIQHYLHCTVTMEIFLRSNIVSVTVNGAEQCWTAMVSIVFTSLKNIYNFKYFPWRSLHPPFLWGRLF